MGFTALPLAVLVSKNKYYCVYVVILLNWTLLMKWLLSAVQRLFCDCFGLRFDFFSLKIPVNGLIHFQEILFSGNRFLYITYSIFISAEVVIRTDKNLQLLPFFIFCFFQLIKVLGQCVYLNGRNGICFAFTGYLW